MGTTVVPMATVLFFAQAREAAGTGMLTSEGSTIAEVMDDLCSRLGTGFAEVATTSRVWRNGEPAGGDDPVGRTDEVAVLPPVSGG